MGRVGLGLVAPVRDLRELLRAGLADARARTDEVFALLRDEAFLERPVRERHRLVFYLGHVEAFDCNLIARDALGRAPFDPALDTLFAFGIDPIDDALPADQPSDWPALDDVRRYAARARRHVDAALEVAPFDGSVAWLRDGWCAHVAIEHRLMHAETLAYLAGQLGFELKRLQGRAAIAPSAGHGMPALRWIEVPAGRATLGAPRDARPAWDNEHDEQVVDVPSFRVASHDVTNAEHLRFVREGGYRERALWTDADWRWLASEGIEHPARWVRDADGFAWRGMFETVPLPLAWPAWLSHAEAAAHARWAGKRLLTEPEYHRAAFGTPSGDERPHPWGDAAPTPARGVFDFTRFDPDDVGSHPLGDSAWGVSDLVGNGWKWTSTIFAPLPGFVPLPFYPGYSAEFFDGRHFVMKGAGPRTSAHLVRRSLRNWFQPHYRQGAAALRLADDAS